MKWGYAVILLVIVIISGCFPYEKNAVGNARLVTNEEVDTPSLVTAGITEQDTGDGWIGEGDPPMGLPTDGIVEPLYPGGIPRSATTCEDFDVGFNAAGCYDSCDSHGDQVYKLVNGGFSDFEDCASMGMVCCISHNLYEGVSCAGDDPAAKSVGCPAVAYWDRIQDYIDDRDRCASQPSPGPTSCTTCNDPYYYFSTCLYSRFFCDRYSNAFCADANCNRQSVLTCKADSDCWPAGSTEEVKNQTCRNSCLMMGDYATCVDRQDNLLCNGDTFDGNQYQYDYYGAISKRNSNSRFGCEVYDTATKTYDCCILPPEARSSLSRGAIWEKAFYYDTVCSWNSAVATPYLGVSNALVANGRIKTIELTCYWQNTPTAPTRNYPCATSPKYSTMATKSDYEKCWQCEAGWGVAECCNDVDDNGDGRIDRSDPKCNTWLDTKEGGVCFAE